MNIAALVNPVAEAPRRSLSNSHSMMASSPVTSAAKLPTPPATTARKQMSQKRNRHDPKPIWAVLEHEVIEGEQEAKRQQLEQRQQSRPPIPTTQAHPQSRSQPPSNGQRNGAPSVGGPSPRGLTGFERPVSNDSHVYDEMAREVCDFLWRNIVENKELRSAIAESPDTEVEIEARWGQIQERHTGDRLGGHHSTECVLKPHVAESTKFESTMSIEQHRRMNVYLNKQVEDSKPPSARTTVTYKHTHEADMFYELDRAGFELLPVLTQRLIASSGRQRIRVTRDMKTGQVIRKIIKHRIANLEISSPQTEWDYRIGINLEIEFPGATDTLKPVIESGRTVESMERKKDRVSYSWLGAYQIDLTQVAQDSSKNHELELELNGVVMLDAATRLQKNEPNDFEGLIAGMLNNLRVLSREVTPPKVHA